MPLLRVTLWLTIGLWAASAYDNDDECCLCTNCELPIDNTFVGETSCIDYYNTFLDRDCDAKLRQFLQPKCCSGSVTTTTTTAKRELWSTNFQITINTPTIRGGNDYNYGNAGYITPTETSPPEPLEPVQLTTSEATPFLPSSSWNTDTSETVNKYPTTPPVETNPVEPEVPEPSDSNPGKPAGGKPENFEPHPTVPPEQEGPSTPSEEGSTTLFGAPSANGNNALELYGVYRGRSVSEHPVSNPCHLCVDASLPIHVTRSFEITNNEQLYFHGNCMQLYNLYETYIADGANFCKLGQRFGRDHCGCGSNETPMPAMGTWGIKGQP